jgi:aminoglycoside N3'-acetyltransferase
MPAPDLASWPARIGVRHGENIMLVADLTRIGWHFRREKKSFTPTMLLDAFLKHIGTEGTLAVMSFNWDLKNGESYNRRNTTTISGVLGQAALEHPSFHRTLNPLHSFAVAGTLLPQFMQCDAQSSFGARSAFSLLKEHAFKLVVLDMSMAPALTYLHHVEELLSVKYRRMKKITIHHLDLGGLAKTYDLYAKRAGYVNNIDALESDLRRAAVENEGVVDGSKFMVIDIVKAHSVIVNDILNNKARRIVQFKWNWWLRDVIKQLLPDRKLSRSALSIQDAAGRN